MADEIEHKFLVRNNGWRSGVVKSTPIEQSYLQLDAAHQVLVEPSPPAVHFQAGATRVTVPIPPQEAIEIFSKFHFEEGGKALSMDGAQFVRIRLEGEGADAKATLTLKRKTSSVTTKKEYEYEIPLSTAKQLLGAYDVHTLSKVRHIVPLGEGDARKWEIDEFHDKLEGLVMAEIELAYESQPIPKPRWRGEDVTEDKRYSNRNLVNAEGPPLRQNFLA